MEFGHPFACCLFVCQMAIGIGLHSHPGMRDFLFPPQPFLPLCRICGAFARGPAHQVFGLCPHCLEKIEKRLSQTPRPHRDLGFRCASVFLWESRNDYFVRRIVYSLKGSWRPEGWRLFARALLKEFPLSPREREKTVLIPLPSRRRGRTHAFGFAQALGELAGIEMDDILQLEESTPSQKILGRSERRRRRIRLKPQVCRTYTDVLLVDDVCTTGATLRAAYEALGRPRVCRAFCLADRPRLWFA